MFVPSRHVGDRSKALRCRWRSRPQHQKLTFRLSDRTVYRVRALVRCERKDLVRINSRRGRSWALPISRGQASAIECAGICRTANAHRTIALIRIFAANMRTSTLDHLKKPAIEVGKIENIVPTLTLISDAVLAGELDKELKGIKQHHASQGRADSTSTAASVAPRVTSNMTISVIVLP
jgi:hypothetical protein